jgi:hypothetical protein
MGEGPGPRLPLVVRVQLELLGPLLAGAVCGFLLGINGPAFVTGTALATAAGAAGLGGVGSGGTGSRWLTFVPGTIFAIGMVAAHESSGDVAKVGMPSPLFLVIPLSALIGAAGAEAGRRLGRRRKPPVPG